MVLSIITRSDTIRKTINADYIMTRINPTIINLFEENYLLLLLIKYFPFIPYILIVYTDDAKFVQKLQVLKVNDPTQGWSRVPYCLTTYNSKRKHLFAGFQIWAKF